MLAAVAYEPCFATSLRVRRPTVEAPRPAAEQRTRLREIVAAEGETVAQAPWLFRAVEVLGHGMMIAGLAWVLAAVAG